MPRDGCTPIWRRNPGNRTRTTFGQQVAARVGWYGHIRGERANMPYPAVAQRPDRALGPAAGRESLYAGVAGLVREFGIKRSFSINTGPIGMAFIATLASAGAHDRHGHPLRGRAKAGKPPSRHAVIIISRPSSLTTQRVARGGGSSS